MFDWIRFLEQHNIEYVTTGRSVVRNNVAIGCPFCGVNDPSTHMGISLDGKGWGCWRNAEHRGKSNARLVQALLHCTSEQAHTIVGTAVYLPVDFMDDIHRMFAEPNEDDTVRELELMPEFKRFGDKPSARPYIDYLIRRGYTRGQIRHLSDEYDLMYCTRGPFKGRIIFPVYFGGDLVTWTGRSIYPSAYLRYKTLSADAEKQDDGIPLAVAPITDFLLWYDDLMVSGADTLFVVEGPFDALRISLLGRNHGIEATCMFTAALTQRQVDLLHVLLPRFKNRYVILDDGMFQQSLRIASSLVSIGIEPRSLPPGVPDPATISREQLLAF